MVITIALPLTREQQCDKCYPSIKISDALPYQLRQHNKKYLFVSGSYMFKKLVKGINHSEFQ